MSSEATASGNAATYAFEVLRSAFEQFRSLEGPARLGADPEAVHDMRVETRRLRAAMSTFEPVLPPTFAHLRAELKWIGPELGAVRDLDVQIEALRSGGEALTDGRAAGLQAILDRLTQARDQAQTALAGALTSESYAGLTSGLTMAMSTPPETDEIVDTRDLAPRVLKQRYGKLKKAAGELSPDSSPPAFHEVRIRAKRLRYTAEAFQPLYGDRASELAEEASRVQDVLGEHQDLIVLNLRLEGLVRAEPPLTPWAFVVIGELIERNRATAKLIREGWDGLEAVRKSWRRLKREF